MVTKIHPFNLTVELHYILLPFNNNIDRVIICLICRVCINYSYLSYYDILSFRLCISIFETFRNLIDFYTSKNHNCMYHNRFKSENIIILTESFKCWNFRSLFTFKIKWLLSAGTHSTTVRTLIQKNFVVAVVMVNYHPFPDSH